MHKDCIILAGGLGTRLRDAVPDKPKCLAEINGIPFLHYILMQLKPFHFCKIVFSVGYQKEMVMDWVTANRKTYGFAIDFAEETEPLGTGGAIKNALQYTDSEDVVVMNGDTFFDVDVDALYASQQLKEADVTMALKPMQNFERYGTVQQKTDGQITGFAEKQACADGLINGGIYVLYKKSFEMLALGDKFSFENDYLQKHLSTHNIYGVASDKYFIDIGIPSDYEKAKIDFAKIFQ
jgi:D-glycero-alpha-D-manno-heptose 1-phosphate guanylyltransferase